MGVMTVNTATRTRLICAKRPFRLGLSALLLVSSVRVEKARGVEVKMLEELEHQAVDKDNG